MDRQQRTTALVAAGAIVILALLYRQGRTPSISLSERSTGQSYDPFVFWMHRNPIGYYHQFPATIAPNTLPMPYQTQDISQSLNRVEVIDNAGCAQ